MKNSKSIVKGGFLLGLIMFASACVVAPDRAARPDREAMAGRAERRIRS